MVTTCIGKILGGLLGARLGGMPWSEALVVGFGLNAQGVIQIILAFVASEYGLITEELFVALVTTAIVTSALAGPLIGWAISRKALTQTEFMRARQ